MSDTDSTIPDALAEDLRSLLITSLPHGSGLDADKVRFKLDTAPPPSPRLVLLPGEPVRVSGQPGTARMPFVIEYISSMDRMTPDEHRAVCGRIDDWLRGIAVTKRRCVLHRLLYLHDLYNQHPLQSIEAVEREQKGTIRGEVIVTLVLRTV
jgi:hypothetical protein